MNYEELTNNSDTGMENKDSISVEMFMTDSQIGKLVREHATRTDGESLILNFPEFDSCETECSQYEGKGKISVDIDIKELEALFLIVNKINKDEIMKLGVSSETANSLISDLSIFSEIHKNIVEPETDLATASIAVTWEKNKKNAKRRVCNG